MRSEGTRWRRTPGWWLVVVLLALLVAGCGGPGGPGGPGDPGGSDPPAADGLAELLSAVDGNGDVDVELRFTVASMSGQAQVLSTTAAGVVEPVLLEIDGVTPGGRAFRAVLVGSNEAALAPGFDGAMRVRARRTEVNGQPLLVGFAAVGGVHDASVAPLSASDAPRFDGFSFLASRSSDTLAGPPVGAILNFDGAATFAGFCTDAHVTGAALFRNRNESVRVVNAALARLTDRVPCPAGTRVNANARVHMEGEVVETRIGTVLMSYGAMEFRRGGNAATVPLFAIGVPERLSDSVRQERFEGEITDGAFVLEPFAMSALERVRDGTMFFRALPASLAGVSAGDLLVARPYPELPEGLLRRVSAVRELPQGIAIDTELVELSDLLRSGGFTFDRPLTADDVVEVIAHADGVDLSAFDALAGGVDTASLNLLPRVRFDEEVFPGVQVSGSLDISIRPVVSFRCAGTLCTQPAIVGKFVVDQTATVEMIGTAGFGGSRRFDLATIKLGTITVLIPPVPVTITPVLVVSLTLSGDGTVAFETRVEQTLNVEAGVEKPSGSPWRRVSELDRSFVFDPPSFDSGQVTAEARLALAAEARVYGGLLYAGADIGGFVRFDGQIPGNPTWALDGGINSFAYFGIDVIVISYEDEFKVFERTWPIDRAPNTPPVLSEPMITSAYDPMFGVVGSVALDEPVTFTVTVSDLEDGPACCEVEWYLTAPSGAITRQTTTGGNPEAEFTPTQLGRYSLRAVATDSRNSSTERTIAFDVGDQTLVDLFLSAGLRQVTFGTPQVGENVTFEARFDDAFDPDCCEIAWRVTRVGSIFGGLFDAVNVIDPRPGFGGEGVIEEFTTSSGTGRHLHTRSFELPGVYLIEMTPFRARAQILGDGPSFDSAFARRVQVTVERIPSNPPRVNSITTSPATIREGEAFLFGWNVDFATDGGTVRVLTSAGPADVTVAFNAYPGATIASWSYSTAGTKTVTVIATDDDGLTDTLVATFTVLPAVSGIPPRDQGPPLQAF